MITFPCPKCGQELSVPDSLAGVSGPCPGCGNVFVTPPGEDAVRVARGLAWSRSAFWRGVGWCQAHRKWAGFIAINLVIWTGAGAWFIPSWIPRPVIRMETPRAASRGRFPPRAELAARLKDLGYYPLSSDPEPGLLRGRRLNRWSYSLDASVPGAAILSLWTPLDQQEVVATTTTIQGEPMLAMMEGLMGRHAEQVETLHVAQAGTFFRGISRKAFEAKGTAQWVDKEENVIATEYEADGFVFERIGLMLKDRKKPQDKGTVSRMDLILRSSAW